MKSLIPLALAVFMFPGLVSAQSDAYNNTPVRNFDLLNYLGKWYEIARFDHSFERGMQNVVAEYSLKGDGNVEVINSGWKDGKFKYAEGKAKQPDASLNPAHLRVSFFLFFYSDYNVLMIDDDYQVALVGSKSPNYLWILSRTPKLEPEVTAIILEEAKSRGYDTSKLIWVDQKMNL